MNASTRGHGLEGMACEAGKGTEPFAAVPDRRNRARGPTKAQQSQPMTCFIRGQEPFVHAAKKPYVDKPADQLGLKKHRTW